MSGFRKCLVGIRQEFSEDVLLMFAIGKRQLNILYFVEISCYTLLFLLQTTSFLTYAM